LISTGRGRKEEKFLMEKRGNKSKLQKGERAGSAGREKNV